MSVKCFSCSKTITKKSPGLVCSRCEKNVHASPECAKLTNKQLQALKSTVGLEWSCEECLGSLSRRSTFFTPGDDSDEEDAKAIDSKKLLRDISVEMRKIIKEEMESVQNSLEFTCDQILKLEESMKNQNARIKHIENKNSELQNENKNLQLRIATLEQRQQETDQKLISNYLEIDGLPETTENLQNITKSVAAKIDVDAKEIRDVRRVGKRQDKAGYLLVELSTKLSRDNWIVAAKNQNLTVGDILPSTSQVTRTNRVYVREALTHDTKTLLYQAKLQLRPSFQYVWCKAGKVYARKTDSSQTTIIRSLKDIKLLTSTPAK